MFLNLNPMAINHVGPEDTMPSPPSIYSQDSFPAPMSDLDLSAFTNTPNNSSRKNSHYVDQTFTTTLFEQDIFALLDAGSRERAVSKISHAFASFLEGSPRLSVPTASIQSERKMSPKKSWSILKLDAEQSASIPPSATQTVLIDSAEDLVTSSSLIVLVDDASVRVLSTPLDRYASMASSLVLGQLERSDSKNARSLLDAALPSSQLLLNTMFSPIAADNSTTKVSETQRVPTTNSKGDLKARSRAILSLFRPRKGGKHYTPSIPVRRNAREFDHPIPTLPLATTTAADQSSIVPPHPKSPWLPLSLDDSSDRLFDSPVSLTSSDQSVSSKIISSHLQVPTAVTSSHPVLVPDSLIAHLHEPLNSSDIQCTLQSSQPVCEECFAPSGCSLYFPNNGAFPLKHGVEATSHDNGLLQATMRTRVMEPSEEMLASFGDTIALVKMGKNAMRKKKNASRNKDEDVFSDNLKNRKKKSPAVSSAELEEVGLFKKLSSKASRIFKIKSKPKAPWNPLPEMDIKKAGPPSSFSRIFGRSKKNQSSARNTCGKMKQAESYQAFSIYSSDFLSSTSVCESFVDPVSAGPSFSRFPVTQHQDRSLLQLRQEKKVFSKSMPDGLDSRYKALRMRR